MFALSEELLLRYNRNILLKECGIEGQRKICQSRVLVVGAGGLGSAILHYLAASGVGIIGVIDGDRVDISNLQRQVIHRMDSLNRLKVDSAAEAINRLNPSIKVEKYNLWLNENNVLDIISNYDMVVVATDNFESKIIINDTCVKLGKPFVFGAVKEFEGQVFTFIPNTPCYRCIFGEMKSYKSPTANVSAGILGAVAGMIGTIQAIETIKLILKKGQLLTEKLLIVDALNMNFSVINTKHDHKCPVCGARNKENRQIMK